MITYKKVSLVLTIALFFLLGCSSNELIRGERNKIVEQIPETKVVKNVKLPPQVKSLGWGGTDDRSRSTSNFLLPQEINKLWEVNLGMDPARVAPVILKHRIYYIGESGSLKCYDLKARKEIWSVPIIPLNEHGTKIMGGGLAHDNSQKLYVTTSIGEIAAIDAISGEVLWRYKFKSPFLSAPTVFQDTIIVTDASGVSRSLSADGRQNWTQQGSSGKQVSATTGRPVLNNEILLLPSSGGTLLAVDKKTGVKKWNFKFDNQRKGYARSALGVFDGDPVVYETNIFYGSTSGHFVSLNIDGSINWRSPIGLRGSPVVISDSLFIISDLNVLTRIDKSDGAIIWSNPISEFKMTPHFYTPILAGSKLWVTGANKHLLSFDPRTGVLIDKIFLGARSSGPPIYYSQSILVYTEAGDLISFE